jgi:cytochrome c-type biogenesis protein CcmH
MLLVVLALVACGRSAVAGDAIATASDPATESRVARLSELLRCLVCQNQTIADSHAELANDLRREIRGQIAAGRSDREILDFMVARYGDFVLYRPPVKASTLVLWIGPFVLLLGGAFALARHLRRRGGAGFDESVSDEARHAAAALLDDATAGGGR